MTSRYSEVHQTHTGVVFLLGEQAYKFKKPVTFPFCDFSTVAARTAACRREVELNGRLSTDVYLGVGTMPTPGGTGGEPAVLMRRMPAERRLSRRVSAGGALDDDVRAIARLMATFHEQCHQGPEVDAEGSSAALRARWTANLDETRRFGGAVLDAEDLHAVAASAEQFLIGRQALLSRRVAEHRIVDGHGDLLADDIFCLDDGPRILDCLEFDDRLRYVDRIDDIAFLAMDLEYLGAPELTAQLLQWYREFSGDTAPPALVHHYLAYRAFVRTKVACLRLEQGDPTARESAHRLMAMTRRHLGAGAVRLVLVGGLPGTGKSTLAGHIADELGHVVLSSDRIRKELAGLNPADPAPAGYRAGIYTPEHTRAVYAELIARAELLLGLGESVTLDASWSSAPERAAAEQLAIRTHARLSALQCQAPAEVAAHRMRNRLGPSDADGVLAAAMRADSDPWPEASLIDTSATADTAAQQAVDRIHPSGEGRPWFAAPRLPLPRTGGRQVHPQGWATDGLPDARQSV
jgi:aminoglycoside phosphotransferase family enzyme/predicted kinase